MSRADGVCSAEVNGIFTALDVFAPKRVESIFCEFGRRVRIFEYEVCHGVSRSRRASWVLELDMISDFAPVISDCVFMPKRRRRF
jgi:hypothetical protein